MSSSRFYDRDFEDAGTGVDNHIFTCAQCSRQYTIRSSEPLDCFFVGLCYSCIRAAGLTFNQIVDALRHLIEARC